MLPALGFVVFLHEDVLSGITSNWFKMPEASRDIWHRDPSFGNSQIAIKTDIQVQNILISRIPAIKKLNDTFILYKYILKLFINACRICESKYLSFCFLRIWHPKLYNQIKTPRFLLTLFNLTIWEDGGWSSFPCILRRRLPLTQHLHAYNLQNQPWWYN